MASYLRHGAYFPWEQLDGRHVVTVTCGLHRMTVCARLCWCLDTGRQVHVHTVYVYKHFIVEGCTAGTIYRVQFLGFPVTHDQPLPRSQKTIIHSHNHKQISLHFCVVYRPICHLCYPVLAGRYCHSSACTCARLTLTWSLYLAKLFQSVNNSTQESADLRRTPRQIVENALSCYGDPSNYSEVGDPEE